MATPPPPLGVGPAPPHPATPPPPQESPPLSPSSGARLPPPPPGTSPTWPARLLRATRRPVFILSALAVTSALVPAGGPSRRRLRRAPPGSVILDLDLDATAIVERRSPSSTLARALATAPADGGASPPPAELPLAGVLAALSTAAGDPRVGGLVIRGVDGLAPVGLPGVADIAAGVRAFREGLDGGRPVVHHAAGGFGVSGTVPYMLAAAASKVLVAPSAVVSVPGLAAPALFLRDALAAAGVSAVVVKRGKYKNAANGLTEAGYTDAHREATAALLSDWMRQVVGAVVAGDRVIGTGGAAAVRAAMDTAPLSAAAAVDAGLVDGTAWRDEVPDVVGAALSAREAARPAALAAAVVEWAAARAALVGMAAHYGEAMASVMSEKRGAPVAGDAAALTPVVDGVELAAALRRMLDAHLRWMEAGGGLPAATPDAASTGRRGVHPRPRLTGWDARARTDWVAEYRAVSWLRRWAGEEGEVPKDLAAGGPIATVLAFFTLLTDKGDDARLLLPSRRDGPVEAVTAGLAARRDAALASGDVGGAATGGSDEGEITAASSAAAVKPPGGGPFRRHVRLSDYLAETIAEQREEDAAATAAVPLINSLRHLSGLPPLPVRPGVLQRLADWMGGTTATKEDGAIRSADAAPGIDAIVLRVDSPGGDVVGSSVAARAVAEASKPVVASYGAVCASGGVYLSAPADAIVAAPGTVTGSIGVILARPDASAAFARAGIRADVVAEGAAAADAAGGVASLGLPWGEATLARVDGLVDDMYRGFVEVVASGRDLPPDTVDALGQGRVWTGEAALARGLVDELGGLDAAVATAARLVGERRAAAEEEAEGRTATAAALSVDGKTTTAAGGRGRVNRLEDGRLDARTWPPPPGADGHPLWRLARAVGLLPSDTAIDDQGDPVGAGRRLGPGEMPPPAWPTPGGGGGEGLAAALGGVATAAVAGVWSAVMGGCPPASMAGVADAASGDAAPLFADATAPVGPPIGGK
ncbi:hypothetical protein I4F81_012412 [Pyropia yezoensis]|uniref:Uncharacterized protein n=1 Tax=Pyropia yezoensis TaxID=2788 RepID=A0ACC3CIF1_PYRYE|nr:hypothetical protein I4F81_012412 [Neopyropia yezoensis]